MKHIYLSILLFAFVTTLVLPTVTYAQKDENKIYWNQFRGPNGSGIMKTANVPINFGTDTNVLWKKEIEGGQSSPVIWDNRIFVTTFSPENEGQLTVVCLDRQKGKILWRKSVSSRKNAQYFPLLNGPASPTPAADHKHVYAYFGTYGILCYTHDGNKVWERQIDPPASQYGMSVSPILYKDTVILVLDDNRGNSRLLAMNRDTGDTVWEQPRPLFRAGWSTPMIWQHELRDELVVLGYKKLTSYNPATGEEIWWTGGFSTETIGVPVAGEGFLFVSDAAAGGRGETEWDAEASWKVTLEDFDKNQDNKIQREEMAKGFRIPLRSELEKHELGSAYPIGPQQVGGWFRHLDKDKDGNLSKADWLELMSEFAMESQPTLIAIKPGAEGNARPLNVAWEINSGIPEIPSPLYCQEKIYLLRKGGILTCIQAADGKQLFRERIGARGQYIASPIAAGDKIITTSQQGTVTVIQIGDTLKVLARNDFGEEIIATPAIAENRIYLRTVDHLYAIGKY